ncbi:hypothetical protein ACFL0W_00795 [Nanoarchaeota archaeon]
MEKYSVPLLGKESEMVVRATGNKIDSISFKSSLYDRQTELRYDFKQSTPSSPLLVNGHSDAKLLHNTPLLENYIVSRSDIENIPLALQKNLEACLKSFGVKFDEVSTTYDSFGPDLQLTGFQTSHSVSNLIPYKPKSQETEYSVVATTERRKAVNE